MEHQTEQKMEHGMETGITMGHIGFRVKDLGFRDLRF